MRMKKHRLWLLLAALIIVIVGVAPESMAGRNAGEGASIEKLEPKAALALIQKNKGKDDFVILDVRTPEEFKDGHIQGAINVDYNSGNFRGSLHDLDKNKTYLVYCRTGRRTTAAVELMVQQGFKRIYRIAGDIMRWRSEGLPLTKGPSTEPPRDGR